MERADLESLVACVRVAPCGSNSQVPRFRLIDAVDEVGVRLAHHKWAGLIKEWDGSAKGERPVAYIAILALERQGKNGIRDRDVGVAAQTMMLVARTSGLGGCMIKSYDAGPGIDWALRARALRPCSASG